MNFQFKLSFDDFLQYQLYTVSQSKRVKKKKMRSWIRIPALLGLLAIYMSFKNLDYATSYGILAATWALGYPLYFKWLYKRHFSKHIKENYKSKIGETINLSLTENTLISEDDGSEAKIKFKEFADIIELPNNLILRTKKGDALIVPKTMNDYKLLAPLLIEKASKNNITWLNETLWKW